MKWKRQSADKLNDANIEKIISKCTDRDVSFFTDRILV